MGGVAHPRTLQTQRERQMSFTVFSARSIVNDIENAIGEEGFYFYMREIVKKELCKNYTDGVNGEKCRFSGFQEFLRHKDGLNIKVLELFEFCFKAVANSSHKKAANAKWLMNLLNELE